MESSFVNIGEQKNALLRNNIYSANDNIIVQVKKESIGRKGAIVSDKIQLAGKYIVLLPTEKFISVSKKIENEDEKIRLKNLVKNILGEYGAIIRTEAQNETEKIEDDIAELIEKWNTIKSKAVKAPSLIYEEKQIVKIIKDLTDKRIERILTTRKPEVKDALNELNFNIPIEEVEEYTDIADLDKKTIWLKSGGFITIEKTEALIAVDVNSGSYIGKMNFEETAEKINEEATVEIAKQIRLRNLRGIIVIDYINLNSDIARQKIIEIMKNEVKKDRGKVDVYEFTELGLLELTRRSI